MEFDTKHTNIGIYAPIIPKKIKLEGGTKLYELNPIEYHLAFVRLLLVFNSK
jgi:hypothetical protein